MRIIGSSSVLADVLQARFEPWSRFLLQPLDRMVPGEDGERRRHGRRFQDVQAPLVVEWVSVDAQREFDDTVDGANLW